MNDPRPPEPDESLHEQAALYAVDALPADEAAKFRVRAREHPELAPLVADYETAASLLAESVPRVSPPLALRGRILAAIAEKPAAAAESPAAGRWLPWGVAAALAVAAGVLWIQNQQLVETNSTLGGKAAALEETRRAFDKLTALTAEKDRLTASLRRQIAELQQRNALANTQIATLTSKLDGSYLASIAWDNTAQEGILKVRRLPAAERGREYQLWVIDPQNAAPVSAGVFTVANDGSATIRFAPAQKVSSAGAFAVSVEKFGGSASPQGPIVLSN